MLCNNLEVWDGVGGRRQVQEGGNIRIPMADSCWQKPTKYCKAITLQFKNKFKKDSLLVHLRFVYVFELDFT